MSGMGDVVIDPVKRLLGIQKPKPQESFVIWASRKVYLVVYVPLFVVLDVLERCVSTIDGLDKSNKLGMAILKGMEFVSARPLPKASDLHEVLRSANDFLGMTAVFGRAKELVAMNDAGKLEFITDKNRSDFKRVNQVLLLASKSFEAVKWLIGVQVISFEWFSKFDKNFLGGVSVRIGSTPILMALKATTLVGALNLTKDFFVIWASVYGVLDNVLTIANQFNTGFTGKDATLKCVKALLAIVADIGKVLLATWYRAAIWFTFLEARVGLFIIISGATAVSGVARLLLDSYNKEPLGLGIGVKA